MKISYQRSMQKNFMVVDPEDLNWDGYECRMLLRNNIEGLLKIRVRPTQEGCVFCYDITSRQPLARIIKGTQWKADEFRTFMIRICDALTRMQTYLLKESCILLDTEHIYIEPESRRIFLCYVPGLDRSFSEDLGKLLEALLECVDHRDKECVVLAYGLYQETRKENYGLEDLLKLIYADSGSDDDEDAYEYSFDTDEFPVQAPMLREERSTGFFEKLKDKVFTRFSRADDADEEEDDGESWFEGLDESKAVSERENESFDEQKRSDEKAREEAGLRAGDTMALSDIGAKTGMRTLLSMESGIADIPIPYFPFVIGKQASLVDHVLGDETVSRLHLKIEKGEEGYVMEDLNSTNGTTLNGELIENNGKRVIVPGDVIGIARLRFRFE